MSSASGITDHHARGRCHQQREEPVEGRPLHQDPAAGTAVLSRVVEDGIRRRRCRGLQVGIGEHDVGALAAELQGHPLHVLGAAGHDPLPDRGGAGEADLADIGVLHQPPAGVRPGAHHHVENTLGQTGLEGQLPEAERGQGRQLGRLEHHRVPTGQRRSQLPAGDEQREVPGGDQADHTQRFVEGHRHPAGHGDGVAQVLVHAAGVVVEHLDHGADLTSAGADGLADVGRLQLRQLLGVVLDRAGQPPEQPGPIGRRDVPPGREGVLRPRHRGVDLVRAGQLLLHQELLGGRVEDGQAAGHYGLPAATRWGTASRA